MKKSECRNLDILWSNTIRRLAGYRCEYCHRPGSQVFLNAAHIVGRSYRGTRWGAWIDGKYDLCGHCLCYTHHKSYDEHGIYEQDIVDSIIGQERKVKIQKVAEESIGKKHDFKQIQKWIYNAGSEKKDSL